MHICVILDANLMAPLSFYEGHFYVIAMSSLYVYLRASLLPLGPSLSCVGASNRWETQTQFQVTSNREYRGLDVITGEAELQVIGGNTGVHLREK